MIYFIINPESGSGRGRAAVPVIERIMRENNAEYSLIHTKQGGDFTDISDYIDYNEAAAAVCVGGDGTIQEYIGLAAGKNIRFGIIPAGSGNDLILSIPDPDFMPVRAFKSFEEKIIYYTNKIIRGKTIDVDAVSVNNGEKYFFNIGGTGIDIQVLKDAQPIKKLFGSSSYFLSLIKNVVTYKTEEMTITVDGEVETDKILLAAVCNGSYYGGGMKVAPPAVMNDGLITLCRIRKMPRIKMMTLFPKVKPGRHINLREVSFVNCLSVKLEFNGKKTINLDGNLYDFENSVLFDIMKNAVRLIV